MGAYGLHVVEDFVFDWQNRARNGLHLPAEWRDFYITNALVIVVGIVAAEIAPVLPWVSLGFATLIGAVVMATPIVFLNMKSMPYFDQTR